MRHGFVKIKFGIALMTRVLVRGTLHGVPKLELARGDFHVRRVARAGEREETPNWSPPEYVVLFSGISRNNM